MSLGTGEVTDCPSAFAALSTGFEGEGAGDGELSPGLVSSPLGSPEAAGEEDDSGDGDALSTTVRLPKIFVGPERVGVLKFLYVRPSLRGYMAFLPTDMDEDDEEYGLIILKVIEENGEEILGSIDDPDELEEVYELFAAVLFDEEEE